MIKVRENSRRFIVEVAAFMLILYGISFCVYLNGDDFMYAAFAKTGILRNVIDYYFTGNGRFWINILDSALLYFGRYAFILVLPWIVLAFVVLFAKNVQRIMAGHSDWKREKKLIRMGMVLFACLDVMCLRETVFWITGMMNYLFPAVLFLFGYLLFQKSRAGEITGIAVIGYYVVCALVSSSVEQYALMFVGMMTLHHGYHLVKKVSIPAYEWVAYGVSLLGLAALLLAPGNFVRIDNQGLATLSLAENTWTLLFQNTVSHVALPYLVMLLIAVTLYCAKENEKVLGKILVLTILVLGGCVVAAVLDKAVVYIAILLLGGGFVALQLLRAKAVFKEHIYFLIVVGIGSQVMLLVSAIWGFRCMLSFFVVYMLVLACLLYNADPKLQRIVLLVGILVSIHTVVAVAFCVAVAAKEFVFKKVSFEKWLSPVLCCAVFLSLVGVFVGYAKNIPTHRMNLQQTEAQWDNSIIIRELPNDIYSWYFVPISEFHEEYYRLLHDIPENVEIIYEALPE